MRKLVTGSAVVSVVLLLALFTFGGILGLVDPASSSVDFGMATADGPGSLFFRVYVSRNLVIIATALVFLLGRKWESLATLLTAAIALPIFDATILFLARGKDAPLTFHIGTAVALTIIATLLWLTHSWQDVSNSK